jgi:hypothetical protein
VVQEDTVALEMLRKGPAFSEKKVSGSLVGFRTFPKCDCEARKVSGEPRKLKEFPSVV